MATTVSYSASMRTRKTTSASNYKSSAASQGYYDLGTNLVGIVHFAGMDLTNKVISAIRLTVTAANAGLGAWKEKTVRVYQANYQAANQSGITGLNYVGSFLGTFSGSFYSNTTNNDLSGALLTNLASYFAAGNNTICLYNPSPTQSSQGYSDDYMQWNTCTITVTYEEPSSQPTMSSYHIDMGSSVTIYTNRQSEAATHTVRFSYFTINQTIATDVVDSVTWTPPLSLAAQTPNATSGWGTLLCDTYIGGVLISTKTCTFTLYVPASITPTIGSVTIAEAVPGIASQFGCYVRTRSKLSVSISAAGAQGSTISSYRTTLNGTVYTASSFTTDFLNTSGSNTLSFTVTDSRGRTATTTQTVVVQAYSPPSLTRFSAERCNAAGTAPQMDGTKVRFTAAGSVSAVNNRNTAICKIFYKLSSATAWTEARTVTVSDYTLAATNVLLSQTFSALSSYDLRIRLQDYFYTIEQTVSIGTKQVMMDFYRDGSGVAFGKVAEQSGYVEFGWPVILSSALGVASGGTGATTAADAIANLGGVKKTGDTMTGNLNIQSSLYPSLYLVPTYNNTTNRVVFEGSYIGAASFAAWEDGSGNNRRMLEVRTKAYQNSLDYAVLLRVADNGSWSSYRVFHSGMDTPIPVGCGGTGSFYAKGALNNLGVFYADTLPASGIDGQICLVPV